LQNNRDGTGHMTYDLLSVLVHQGSQANTGHYFGYVQTGTSISPCWKLCNDRTVTQVGMCECGLTHFQVSGLPAARCYKIRILDTGCFRCNI
jgi:ubiquitin C-terminal hydrolase